MSRKAGIIVFATIIIIVLNNLRLFGYSALGGFIDFSISLFIIYRAYRLYKKVGEVPMPIVKRLVVPAQVRPTAGTTTSTANQIGVVALIFGLVFISAGYQIVSAGAINFFVWGDHILGNSARPVLPWALVGLFAGAMMGSLVMWRKYRINFKWCLLTLIPFFSVLTILHVLSSPLQSIIPRPLVVTTDSTVADTGTDIITSVRKKRRSVKTEVPIDSNAERVEEVEACAEQLANVSVNARTDSVNIYYRTTEVRDGSWGPWKSKFIPHQGEFSLTDGGPVRANSLQYYYEINSVLTRSAQNPYQRVLCEGELVIDTY